MASRKPDPEQSAQGDPFAGTPYRIVARLGGSGAGEVFVVEHQEIGRRFAAKILRAERSQSPHEADRMRLEAQALGRLSHPNIVSVVDFAITPQGRPFFVTELLRGETLARVVERRGALPVPVAVACALDLLAALEATHAAGLVHRAVKPSNVFLAQARDRTVRLKLIDFGITRVLPGAPASAPAPLAIPTETGEVVETPSYPSPAGASADFRADVYGAALVLYTLLAGRDPFDRIHGWTPFVVARVQENPEPPSHFVAAPVPPELDALVLRALEKEPNAGFATAGEFRVQLARVAVCLARPVGWLETTAFSQRREPALEARAKDDWRHSLGTLGRARKIDVPALLLFAAGVVVAGLAVAALSGVFGGSR